MIGADVVVGENAVIDRSVIGDGCRIGDGATIVDSYVWAGAEVGSRASVEGAVVASRAMAKTPAGRSKCGFVERHEAVLCKKGRRGTGRGECCTTTNIPNSCVLWL